MSIRRRRQGREGQRPIEVRPAGRPDTGPDISTGHRPDIGPDMGAGSGLVRAGERARRWVGRHVRCWVLTWWALSKLSPAGVRRAGWEVWRVAVNAQGWADLRALRESGDTHGARAMTREVARSTAVRLGISVVAGPVVAGVAVGLLVGVWWLTVLAVVASPPVLGRWAADGDGDGPVVEPPVVEADAARPLDRGVVVEALAELGIPKLTAAINRQGPSAIQWLSPPTQTKDRSGWEVQFVLPLGVTVNEVMAQRSTLAGNLDREVGCVWVDPLDGGHPRQVSLYVTRKPLAKAKALVWSPPAVSDMFEPMWLGVDKRSQPVRARFIAKEGTMHTLIAAMSGMGKTNLGRLIAANAALDVDTELHIINAKGGVDFDGLEPVCHTYLSSAQVDDIIGDVLNAVVDLRKRIETRSHTLRELAKDPDKPTSTKVTATTARMGVGLHLIVLIIEEFQRLFNHPEHGKELQAEVEDIVRISRGLGCLVLLSTQKPSARVIPTDMRDNFSIGLCGRVRSYKHNDMVLGDGSATAGYDASRFTSRDRGVFWMVGDGEEPTIVRVALVPDEPEDLLVEVGQAAYLSRKVAGTLTGMAADHDPDVDEPASTAILEDIAQVWRAGEDRVHLDDLAGRLADLDPNRYGGWMPEQITQDVRRFGLESKQVWLNGRNRRGLYRTDFHAAYTEWVEEDNDAA